MYPISLLHSLKFYVTDPQVTIGSLNLGSHVVTTYLECYRYLIYSFDIRIFFFLVVVLRFFIDSTGLQGTRSALYANGRESVTVTVQEVNPRSVGALIALYERAVGIYASLINVNAYHQPGIYSFLFLLAIFEESSLIRVFVCVL